MKRKVEFIRNKANNLILRALTYIERLINRLFVLIRAKIRATEEKGNTPNSPASWEKMYLSKIAPVHEIKSEISKAIINLTKDGEYLLETGCGSGLLSAELSISKRKIAVCDFSEPILERVTQLFILSGLSKPDTYLVDITKKFPFSDNQFDVVWNSGVLEHWTDEELMPVISELARCAKRCVISFVPNEKSLLYRFGREDAEKHGIAPWGRELPRSSLKFIFESAGLINVYEKTICSTMAIYFLTILDPVFAKKIEDWLNLLPDQDPVKEVQGYLLLTVGYKE